MNLLNELLSLSESAQGTTLVGLTINGELITDNTKDEIWPDDFDCDEQFKLISLEGAPKEVKGDFNCNANPKLTSLKGAPDIVRRDFYCHNNPKLESLEGSPKEVDRDFWFDGGDKLKFTSLKGGPVKVGRDFKCYSNPNLTSLEGAPKEVGRDFDCSYNDKLTSLKGIHKQITINLGGKFVANYTPIRSNVLGLLLIKGCTGVHLDNEEVQDILNKYLPNNRGNKAVIECQSELLDSDLDDFAEL